MSDTKRCAKCATTKAVDEFPPSKQTNDGRFAYCRECKRQADREYTQRNKGAVSVRRKAAYAANPEPAKARRRKRYYDDPARAVAEAAAWNRSNPDRRSAIARKWQQANMQTTVREATRRRYATRKGAPTIFFTAAQLAQRAVYYGDRCWVCRGEWCEWDHVKPLSKGGWHCLSNLRPICRHCNASKRDRWPFNT